MSLKAWQNQSLHADALREMAPLARQWTLLKATGHNQIAATKSTSQILSEVRGQRSRFWCLIGCIIFSLMKMFLSWPKCHVGNKAQSCVFLGNLYGCQFEESIKAEKAQLHSIQTDHNHRPLGTFHWSCTGIPIPNRTSISRVHGTKVGRFLKTTSIFYLSTQDMTWKYCL